MKKLNTYAIYDKNDTLLTVGTAKELAKFLEIGEQTFWTYLSAKKVRKTKIFKIEDEEESE